MCRARALAGSELWALTDDERNAIVVSDSCGHALQEVLAEVEQPSNEDLNDAGRLRALPAGSAFQHFQFVSGWHGSVEHTMGRPLLCSFASR